jgi:hypothetical protein
MTQGSGGYEQIPYYPPRNLTNHWAPEKIDRVALRAIATAQRTLGSRVSALAKKYFLANALVEGRWGDFGFNWPDTEGAVLNGYDPEMSQCIQQQSSAAMMSGTRACQAFAFFDYKTGAYANHVRGAHASVAARIALWNGVGRSVGADANNHAAKVLAMHRALSDPKNAELVNAFREAGGTFER